MSANADFSEILSTTLANYSKKLSDNVFTKYPLGYFLMRKGKMEFQSGESIVRQLITADNSTFMTYSGYESIDLTPQDSISAAKFDWRQAAVSVVVNGLEETQNMGTERMIDLVAARVQIAEKTMQAQFNSMFHTSYGTGNSNKDWFGLPYIVGDEGTSVTTVGGIDCTTTANAFWRSNVTDSGGDVTLTLAKISAEVDAATYTETPDFAITTLALYEAYEALLIAKLQFRDVDAANAGFQTISNRGVTIFWDRDCTTKHWWTLNSNHITLVGSKKTWMKARPFITPEDKDARSSLILSHGNLTTDERRAHSVHKVLVP